MFDRNFVGTYFPRAATKYDNIISKDPLIKDTLSIKKEEEKTRQETDMKMVDVIKDYLLKNENTYNNTKTELYNLINDTLNNKYQNLSADIEVAVNKRYEKETNVSSDRVSKNDDLIRDLLLKQLNQKEITPIVPSSLPSHPNNQISDHLFNQGLKESKQAPKNDFLKKKQRDELGEKKLSGHYYKLTDNCWKELREKYPDLSETQRDNAFVRGTDKFIKYKKKYIKVDEEGIAKLNVLIK